MARFAPQLLVFDLDGTLIDSQTDLANSVNAMLAHYGRPTLPKQIISGYIGDGASVLVRRALAHTDREADEPDPRPHSDPDDAFIAEALAWFIAWYRIHKLDHTFLYDGVREALTAIRAAHPGLPMAVLTNKPVDPSRAICTHFALYGGPDSPFFQVYGGNSFASKKPDPEGLLTLIAEASARTGAPVLPSHTVMVGDSHVDVETARAAGTLALGCTFGLSPDSLAAAGPDLSVDRPADWPAALSRLPAGAPSSTQLF
jgi:phosphoglycolate phosphatase